MRALIWIVHLLWLLLFFLLLAFGIKNDQIVTLHFFFGNAWSIQLIFVIFVAFTVGALFGVAAWISQLLKHRREVSRLRREVTKLQSRNQAVANSTTAVTTRID